MADSLIIPQKTADSSWKMAENIFCALENSRQLMQGMKQILHSMEQNCLYEAKSAFYGVELSV